MVLSEPCKSCRFRINDMREGHLCVKVREPVTLWDGSTVLWPGVPAHIAFSGGCERGLLREARMLGKLSFWIGL